MRLLSFFLVLLCFFVASCGGPQRLADDGGSIRRNGVETFWATEDFPIQVLISSEVDQSTAVAVFLAAEIWNVEVDREVFEVVRHDFSEAAPSVCGWIGVERHDIHAGDDPRPERWDAYHRGTTVEGSGHACSGLIVFDQEIPDSWLVPIGIHELGHGLTLDHDGDRHSIMFPTLRGTTDTRIIQPEDVERVQRMVDGTFVPFRPVWMFDGGRITIEQPHHRFRFWHPPPPAVEELMCN